MSADTNQAVNNDAGLWRSVRMDRDLTASIEGLRDVLRSTEREGEELRHLPDAAVEALREAGLFKVSLPEDLGGWEADPVLELEVFEAVARLSTGACWNLIVGNFHSSLPAVFCSDEAARAIFLESPVPIVAGQPAPMGKGRAVEGGIVVSGRYGWGSGIAQAGWVIGGCVVEVGAGEPSQKRAWVAPRDSVEVLDNWHVAGLAATGSSDYVVEELFVPDGWWFPFPGPGPLTVDAELELPNPLRGGAKYRPVVRVWAMTGHIGLLLGAAERALECIADLAQRKKRTNARASVAARDVFRNDLGSHFVLLSATRDNAIRLFSEVAATTAAGEPVGKQTVQEISALGAHAARTATAVAQMAYTYAGGSSVYLDSPLQRILRDLLVAQQHLLYADVNFEYVGEMLIARAGSRPAED